MVPRALSVAMGFATACSVYDPGLLDPPESKRDLAQMGTTVTGGMSPDAPDALPSSDAGAAEPLAGCGDGKLGPNEKCDTGVPAGMPGACPSACAQEVACAPRALSGSGCQAECVVVTASCRNDDDCCPPACTVANDNDCSSACGNGQVDADQGETCEAGMDAPCPTKADCDDGDACTEDVFTGSAANCNAACDHPPISEAANGDGCCPDGANANSDDDCAPKCGNGVREDGEECDGGMGCDAECTLTMTAEQADCMDRLVVQGSPDEACQRCSCVNCTSEVFDCRDDSDTARRMKCDVLVNCALANDCTGNPCYCGTDVSCLFPNGPCIAETTDAAETTDPLTLLNRNMDATYALGRANLLGACAVMNCADVCP